MTEKRAPMILAQPQVSEEPIVEQVPAEAARPVVQRTVEASAEADASSVDVLAVAERVYQLMREELAAERIRRGLPG